MTRAFAEGTGKKVKPLKFAKEERIKAGRDFRDTIKSGRKAVTKNFLVFTKDNLRNHHRLGLVVSRDVGKATYRNRVKRLLREFFRLRKAMIPGSMDIVVVVKKGCRVNKLEEVCGELGRILNV